jgi:3-oxoacyl-[acyl-carrier protein] reductase
MTTTQPAPKPLAGKLALVTGGSRGIGAAIARRLARDGAKVAVHYGSSKDQALKVVADIRGAGATGGGGGGQAFAIAGDLRSTAGIRDLFANLDREVTAAAKIDILVNNAGVAPMSPFLETTEADFDHVFSVNVKSPFFVTQKALPRIPDGGRIVNISSVVSHRTFPGLAAYASTKGAVDTFTIQLAAELGTRNITVNAVNPGIIDTDMSAAIGENRDAIANDIQALKRLGKPEDVANVVAMLAGPDSAWLTGQLIDASGGTRL